MPINPEARAEPIPGYRLIDRLGSGGYGEVWRAEAPGGLQKAVKLVHGKFTGSQDSKVDRELKGLTRMRDVRHPFILSMDRFDIIDGQLIIVMELAERDLTARLLECQEQGLPGIPRKELLRYMMDAAEALDLMNKDYDLQHLDIKPSNLFLVGNHIKVADFGLAKDLEGVRANVTSGMTPIYAAPETFNGWAARATDQYSLAIVYQELLTSQRPFPGPSAIQLMSQHLTKEPDLSSLPAADRAVLRKGLEKDPEMRYPSCVEMVQRLIDSGETSISRSRPLSEIVPPTPARSQSIHSTPRFVGAGGPIIGIDLGTTNSVLAVVEGKEVRIIPNAEGNRLTPSVVAFTDKGERLVGTAAKSQSTINPTRTLFSIKRFIGRRRREVADEEKYVPFDLVGDGEDLVKVKVDDKTFAPPEISAMVLRKLKEYAEDFLGQTVSRAVITVPAYFNDSQRQATKDAAYIAGLTVERIINEPTAAALAYGLDRARTAERVAVFDLGGGTFDVTILKIKNGVFDVLSTSGDTHLGGDDFDLAVVHYLADHFEKEHGFDPRRDRMALQRMLEAAEKAKRELSSAPQTEINLPFIASDATGPKHLQMSLTKSQFEGLIDDLVERCRMPCMQALEDAHLRPDEINEVIVVGGSSRVPKVREFVRQLFGKEPYKGVHPDEAIASGAAIQGGMLTGGLEEILLLDVTPLSLGVETRGGVTSRLIERNTTVPAVAKKVYTTAEDNQTEVGIHVLQGEREFAADNRTLGIFWLEGIKAAPKGTPRIEVTFSIDSNGILHVGAKDLETGREEAIRVESSSGLSQEDIDRMREEAEEFANADKERRDAMHLAEDAELACVNAEKKLKNLGSLVTEADRKAVQAAIKKLRDVVQANAGTAVISTTTWELDQAIRNIKIQQPQKGGGRGGNVRDSGASNKPGKRDSGTGRR